MKRLAILFTLAMCGCYSPLVVVNRVYVTELYGTNDNHVTVRVDKDEQINPNVTGVQAKLK